MKMDSDRFYSDGFPKETLFSEEMDAYLEAQEEYYKNVFANTQPREEQDRRIRHSPERIQNFSDKSEQNWSVENSCQSTPHQDDKPMGKQTVTLWDKAIEWQRMSRSEDALKVRQSTESDESQVDRMNGTNKNIFDEFIDFIWWLFHRG